MLQINDSEQTYYLQRQIEALLFVSPQPVSSAILAEHLSVSEEEINRVITIIKEHYLKTSGLTILNVAGGWQMATAPDLADIVESFAATLSMQRIRLSRAALETLAVIAYNQPITMSEIEEIRAVRCDRVVETLLKNGLIERPHHENRRKSMRRYRTTDKFLEVFGLSSISALPSMEELQENNYDDSSDDKYAEELKNELYNSPKEINEE